MVRKREGADMKDMVARHGGRLTPRGLISRTWWQETWLATGDTEGVVARGDAGKMARDTAGALLILTTDLANCTSSNNSGSSEVGDLHQCSPLIL